MKSITLVFLLVTSVLARTGFGPTEQEWGYVTVREGAHIFWWLHQTTARVEDYTTVPLVIWLQGGPGASSTGYGNFAELGPLDADLNPRPTSWTNDFNVLFVDNPVGAGFSYTESNDLLTTTNEQIAADFLVFLQGFYDAVPDLQDTPLYIFSESYGGKMTAEIGLAVDRAVKDGKLSVNLKAVGLGDSWISPVDSVLTWGPYLLNLGAIDQQGYDDIQSIAQATAYAIASEDYRRASDLWAQLESVIELYTVYIDFYNILTKIEVPFARRRLAKPGVGDSVDDKIDEIMNTEVAEALGVNRTWGRQSNAVFNALYEDFMKPVTEVVELLLNTTNIRVIVYNGQLDLIVDTPGTAAWVNRLKYDGAEDWKTAPRFPVVQDHIVEGYGKILGNLEFYWVNRAGHMVPLDNPAAMRFILQSATGV